MRRVVLAVAVMAGLAGGVMPADAAHQPADTLTIASAKDIITDFFAKPRDTRIGCYVTRVGTESITTRHHGRNEMPVMESSCGTFNQYETVAVVAGKSYTLKLNILGRVVSATEGAAE